MKWRYKNKYTARTLGVLVFLFVIWFVLFFVVVDALKEAAIQINEEMKEFINELIKGWKSWDKPRKRKKIKLSDK